MCCVYHERFLQCHTHSFTFFPSLCINHGSLVFRETKFVFVGRQLLMNEIIFFPQAAERQQQQQQQQYTPPSLDVGARPSYRPAVEQVGARRGMLAALGSCDGLSTIVRPRASSCSQRPPVIGAPQSSGDQNRPHAEMEQSRVTFIIELSSSFTLESLWFSDGTKLLFCLRRQFS